MVILLFTLLVFVFILALSGATYFLTNSVVRIEEGHIGYYTVRGQPVHRTLTPGLNVVSFKSQAYQVSVLHELKELTEEVILPDGAEIKITVSYAIEPDPDNVWKLHKYADQIDTVLEKKIRSCLSRYSSITSGGPQTWEAALEAYDDIRIELHRAMDIDKYGLRLTELEVVSIRKAGVMANEDLRKALRSKSQSNSELEKAKRRGAKLKELESLADQLRQIGTPEQEIKRTIERTRIQILDDE